MVEHYDFDNDGNRLVGPDGIYVLASDYEKLEAALREIAGDLCYLAAWDIANAALNSANSGEVK